MRGVVPFGTGAALGKTPGNAPERLWTVIELVPFGEDGQPQKVRRPTDLKTIVEGRILPLDLAVFEEEEQAIAEASVRAEQKPGHCFAAVEFVAFTFTRLPR